jgi:ketosteroid isomerase-like protein
MTHTETRSHAATIRGQLAATDRFDTEEMGSYFTEDVVIVVGNLDPVEGRKANVEFAAQFFATLKGIRHEIHDIWQASEDPDVVISRMTVHYTKLDGTVVSLPCANTFRMRGELIAEDRVHMDATPLYA